MRPTVRAANPAGKSPGRTKRVTVTATISPTIENKPNCANPGKPEKSIALKPQIDVSTPRRNVGQMRSNVVSGGLSGATWVNR